MARKKASKKAPKKVAKKVEKKKIPSPGSLSKAVPNDVATQKLQQLILKQIKSSEMNGSQLHKETGISLAMSRRLVRGDVGDMKVSTLSRLTACKKIGLVIKVAA